jgi:hypothetical protein
MQRLEREGQVAYRDRSRGWSLLFLCLVFPVLFLVAEEAFRRPDTAVGAAASVGALAAVGAAFFLNRTHTLLIDRDAGTLVTARMHSFWGARRSYRLSEVNSVLLGMKVLDHSTSRGVLQWSEHVYTILIDLGETRILIHSAISGEPGKRLALSLAKDLGVPVRNTF